MLNGISLSYVLMVVGALLLALAIWRLIRACRPARRHNAATAPEAARQDPQIRSLDSERGE